MYLLALREKGRGKLENGSPSPVSVMPLTLDVLFGAPWEVCSPSIAAILGWKNRYTPSDICYIVRDLSNDSTARSAIASTWGSQAANVWIMSEVDEPSTRAVKVDALVGKPAARRSFAALAAAGALPALSSCKWIVTSTTIVWTNPRIILESIQGASPSWPVALGYYWYQMGFIDGVTAAAGGNAIWSRAAWDDLQVALATGSSSGCVPNTMKSDDVLIGVCALIAGVVPVNMNNYDSSGALSLNGVPLEPGPPPEQLGWLQQPHNRGAHWASIEGMSPSLLTRTFTDYMSVYGPTGRLIGGSARSFVRTSSTLSYVCICCAVRRAGYSCTSSRT